MREVVLSRGKTALVDDCDYGRVSQYKWCATKTVYKRRGKIIEQWYAMRYINGRGVLMHRFILNNPKGNVDHIDGNGIDNRRKNLRVATVSQNAANSIRMSAKSGFKGVYPCLKRWRARICVDGNRICLGTYSTPEEAAMAYGLAAIHFFGEFARLK